MIDERVVTERAAWARRMTHALRGLPVESLDSFLADGRTPAAAESYLRRALEAMLDLGRHIAAKGFGEAVVEYKEIARALGDHGALSKDDALLLRDLAGYRNRMVHFYDAVSEVELYEICSRHLDDVDRLLDAMLAWVAAYRRTP